MGLKIRIFIFRDLAAKHSNFLIFEFVLHKIGPKKARSPLEKKSTCGGGRSLSFNPQNLILKNCIALNFQNIFTNDQNSKLP